MSRYQSNGPLDCKVYVGGLTKNASREEIERAFAHYGKLKNVFVARNPPGFAFIEFQDPQDAEDSVRALDGRVLCGVRVRVEISHGKSRAKGPMKRSGGDSGRRRRSRSFDRRRNSYSRSRSRSRGDRNGSGSMGGGMVGGRDYGSNGSGYRDRMDRDRGSDRDRDSRRRMNMSNRSRSRS